jgi:hypothetical protein
MFQVSSFKKKMFQVSSFRFQEGRGQLLIEAMIGISMVVVGLLGIFGLVSRSISLNRVVSDQFIANYLAAEGIEITKNIIDADLMKDNVWNNDYIESGDFEIDYQTTTFKSGSPTSARTAGNNPLLFDSRSNLYSYQGGNPTNFIRAIKIELIPGGNEIKVNSIVTWKTRGAGEFIINLEDHFFNWQ